MSYFIFQVIKYITILLCYNIQSPILICAPTGTAAFNIGGTTIHQLFKMKVGQQSITYIHELGSRQKALLINLLKSTCILIIDEISMVSMNTLSQINYSLQQSKKKQQFIWRYYHHFYWRF